MPNRVLNEDGGNSLNENGSFVVKNIDFSEHDAIIETLLPDIEAYQDAYIQTHPYYFQGLPTHSAVPIDSVAADRTGAPPTKPTSWDDSGLIASNYPFSVEIREYKNIDNEKGYQVIFRSSDAVNTYIRSVGYGIASDATFNWKIL